MYMTKLSASNEKNIAKLPKLSADMVNGFVQKFLLPNFDSPTETPKFHHKMWEMCCSDDSKVAIAAPRGHGKSSAITLSYVLCEVLFRTSSYVLVVSDTETQAGLFVSDIKMELTDNERIINAFGVHSFEKDAETDIIVRMRDGHQFRITARGATQRVRGLKWRHQRPNLLVIDDLEDDTQVLSKDRREKLSHWFFSALLPCINPKKGKIRVVGTILHLDSLLESLLHDGIWLSERFQAHTPTYRTVLWPGMYTKNRLQAIRAEYVARGIPEVYSREYLNWPIDEDTAFFRRADFNALDFDLPPEPIYYAAADFAITKHERSDYSVIAVCCLDAQGRLIVVDMRRGRWDSLEIIDNIFKVQVDYRPSIFTMESDKIQKSLGPIINVEMVKRGIFINVNPLNPTSDKLVRARSFNARMKAGSVYFDEKAKWFPECQSELLRFPRDKHDDQVDALSWIGLTLDKIQASYTEEELYDSMYEEEIENEHRYGNNGICEDTGY
jgi:predicted phage terminase large subunit-like protein